MILAHTITENCKSEEKDPTQDCLSEAYFKYKDIIDR